MNARNGRTWRSVRVRAAANDDEISGSGSFEAGEFDGGVGFAKNSNRKGA